LSRNLESTRDAQKTATDELVASIEAIKAKTGTGADPGQSYDIARRALATCESRVRAAHNRIRVVETNGQDFFHQWSKENTEYEDRDLKESSRQNRVKLKASFESVIHDMWKADDACRPVLTAIRDQMLFLKHHRNAPAVPERPPGSSDPALPAEALAKQTELAGRRAEEFVASARVPSKP